jgi:lipopolysaccharide transport protein LptA
MWAVSSPHEADMKPMSARFLALVLLLPSLVFAQAGDLQLPISLDADSMEYDGKTSMLMYRNLRLSQGSTHIAADIGRASQLDFNDSVWQFSGNVVIDVDAGHIECESAELSFKDTQLRLAVLKGSPATFEMRRPGNDEVTYAQAGNLKYDLVTGVIEFSDEAMITEAGNQISSSFLVYNIREQRINAQSAGDDEKVKITVVPDTAKSGDETAADETTLP